MEYKFEFDAYRDSDLAQIYCTDFLNGCMGEYVIKPAADYYAVFDSKASAQKPYFAKAQLRKLNKPSLFALYEETFYESAPPLEAMTRAEMELVLLMVTREDFITMHGQNNSWCDIEYYDFIARGYSQGEAAKVVNADGLAWIEPKFIEDLFYDAPIGVRCEIYARETSDEAYEYVDTLHLDEYMCDRYDWDRAAMIKAMENAPEPLVRMAAFVLETNRYIIDTPTYA